MENTELNSASRFAVCLDVGGTSVKSAIVSEDGLIAAESMSKDPVDSSGSKDTILNTFAASLEKGLSFLWKRNLTPAGIGIAIGGPFDYEKGISKIKNLDKYEALYDVNVKKCLQEILRLDKVVPFLFDVDGWAFARGEAWAGAARDFNRIIVFTMGTGTGSAFAVNGRIVSEGTGVPWFGWIAGQKYKEGILNDYISRTYMIKRYAELAGEEIDIDEMAHRAENGEENAGDVFIEIGSTLGKFLQHNHIPDFKPECLVFGGQISKAFHLFAPPIKTALINFKFLQAVIPAADIEGSALKGVAKYIFDSI